MKLLHSSGGEDSIKPLPDNRKRGKSDVRQHCKQLEMLLKKTAAKHVKYTQAVVASSNLRTNVRPFLALRYLGDMTSLSFVRLRFL
jgi:hypothetical protein